MTVFCSVLIPSRRRWQHLNAAMSSLNSSASEDSSVEFLVRLDEDDHEARAGMQEWMCYSERDKAIIGPRLGYSNLHKYYEELIKESLGEWLLLFNDDALMLTKDWDDKLKDFARGLPKDGILMAVPEIVGQHIPPQLFFLHRGVIEVLGRLSPIPHTDHWIHALMVAVDRVFYAPIKIYHADKEIDDQTAKDRVGSQFAEAFNRQVGVKNIDLMTERLSDIQKLRERIIG